MEEKMNTKSGFLGEVSKTMKMWLAGDENEFGSITEKGFGKKN